MRTNAHQKESAGHEGGKHDSLSRLTALSKQAWPRLRLMAPAIVAALLLTPFVLANRLKQWMSPDPFFTYIHFFLFFFPTPSPAGAYLERSVITLLFVAAGTGIAFLAVCGCIWIDGEDAPAYNSDKSRAIGVCVLIFFCFFSGSLSSYAPRLKGPCRALVFSTLWELTSQYNMISARIFLNNFYPALVAMIVGIFCNLVVFPRTARHTSIEQLCKLFDGTQQLTAQAVQDFFQGTATTRRCSVDATTAQSATFRKLREQVQSLQIRLELNLDAAKYELSFARIPVSNLQALLPILRDIRGWFSCGLVCLKESELADDPIVALVDSSESRAFPLPSAPSTPHTPQPVFDFEDSIRGFSADIIRSLDCLRQCISKCTGSESAHKRRPSTSGSEKGFDHLDAHDDPELALTQQRADLRASIRTFKSALSDAIRGSRSDVVTSARRQRMSDQDGNAASESGVHFASSELTTPDADPAELGHLFRNDTYQISFLMISLLEIALLVDACLKAALNMAKAWKRNTRRKLRMPAAQWRYWLGRTTVGADDGVATADERVDALLHEDDPASPTSEAQLDEVDYFDNVSNDLLAPSSKLERTPSRVSSSIASVHGWVTRRIRGMRRLFVTRHALRYRMALSNSLGTLRHSRHIKFGFKLTAGIVLLTLPAWLSPVYGKTWWLGNRGQWMAISYLFCLETSTGASVRTSLFRILGTILGSLLGLVVSEISRGSPYAIAVVLTVATLPPSYLMLFTQFQGVGIVMGLTLPIVALIPQEDGGQSPTHVAWNRGYMIFFGIIAALLVNLFIWPIHARIQLVRKVASITSQLQSLYLSLSRQMLSGGLTSSHKSNAAFAKLEIGIESRISQARGLIDIMSMEVSLKPKRTKVLSELLDHLQIILELLIGLRRCREHGLRSVRQHAVVNVLELRQSLIASVLLVLWTTGQALQTKAPLPQCLPSPRLALQELTEAVAEQLRMMVRGVESSQHSFLRDRPDAFHALDSLNSRSILINVRRRNRKQVGLHSIQSYSPVGGSRSGATSPTRDTHRRLPTALSGSDTPATTAKKSLDYAMFFILAEHALLEEIVSSLEQLLELCRSMVGEASFLRTEFVPDFPRGLDDIRSPEVATPPVQPRQAEPSGSEAAQRNTPSSSDSPALQHRPTARTHLVPDQPNRVRDPSPLNHALHSSNLRSSAVIDESGTRPET